MGNQEIIWLAPRAIAALITLARLAEVQGRAAVERQQGGHVAGIEREGHAVEHGAILIKGDALAVIRHQIDQAALLHHDPLGRPVLPEV